jgi:Tfp pilus assembly ATPase PilU
MQTLDQDLREKVDKGLVSVADARSKAVNKKDFV